MKKTVCLAISSLLIATVFMGCTTKKEDYEACSYTSGETVNSVTIDVRDRIIEVSLSEDNKVHIVANSKDWSDFIGGKAPSDTRKITLKVPNEALDSLSIFTTNEDITLVPVNVGDVTLESNGGNISFEKLNAQSSVNLKAKNGNIGGTIIGSYDDYSVSCSIKKGESNLPAEKEGGTKNLIVSVNNCDVDVSFVDN